MTNNDILRRLRYAFDFNDKKMIKIFALADYEASREEISNWLKKEDDEAHVGIYDKFLAMFLNGFIILNRGKREGEQPKPEKTLNNNLILRKLKIALTLTDEDIVETLKLVDLRVSKHEINAFFRKPGQRQYRQCKDQILRNFLHGLQLIHRNTPPPISDEEE